VTLLNNYQDGRFLPQPT